MGTWATVCGASTNHMQRQCSLTLYRRPWTLTKRSNAGSLKGCLRHGDIFTTRPTLSQRGTSHPASPEATPDVFCSSYVFYRTGGTGGGAQSCMTLHGLGERHVTQRIAPAHVSRMVSGCHLPRHKTVAAGRVLARAVADLQPCDGADTTDIQCRCTALARHVATPRRPRARSRGR